MEKTSLRAELLFVIRTRPLVRHCRKPSVLAALLLTALVGCTGTGTPNNDPGAGPDDGGSTSRSTSSPRDGAGERRGVTGTVATGLAVPWGIAFLPDGSAIATERDTRRVLQLGPSPGGTAEVTHIGTIEEAAPQEEAGLLGVAVSPDFAQDDKVFFYASTETDNRVLMATLDGGDLGEPTPILTGIPRGVVHDGGRLAFGPDGFLYVSTGETGDPELAQDPDSLAGKILRITPEGDAAPDNPFDSAVWSLGHRNVQGLAFDDAGRLWASEFGDQTFDELNLIERGANYGWPEVEGRGGEPEYVDPLLTWSTEDASPSGLAFADGALWMAALRGERLWHIPLGGDRPGEPVGLLTGDYGRLRTVVTTPEGDLWVATSNRDGRGAPTDADDRILRFTPG